MIRLGVRLALRGGRSGIVRVALIALALGAGVATLVLGTWTVSANLHRSEFVLDNTFGALGASNGTPESPPGRNMPYVAWSSSTVAVPGTRTITSYAVAASGPGAPRPRGVHVLPSPGTALVSPALRDLLASNGGAALRGALSTRVVGTLGSGLVRDPHELVVLRGYDLATLRRLDPHTARVEQFSPIFTRNAELTLLSVTTLGIILFLLPLLVFVVAAARLGARRREQRLAVMRLVGATPRQARLLAAVETTTAGVIGMALGIVVALAVRSWLVGNGTYFAHELPTSPLRLALLALVVPVVAAVSAPLALRRIGLSPLGVERRTRRRKLSAWRWWMLTVGWVSFAIGGILHLVGEDPAKGLFLGIGVVGVALGLIGGGAWLVQRLARALQARAERPGVLLASRRLSDDPRAGFRPMAVLVVTVFACSLLVVVIPAVQRDRRHPVALTGSSLGSLSLGSLNTAFPARAAYPEMEVRNAIFFGESTVNASALGLAKIAGVGPVVRIQGFDPDLSAAALPTDSTTFEFPGNGVALTDCPTLAAALRASPTACRPGVLVATSTRVVPGAPITLRDTAAALSEFAQGFSASPTPTPTTPGSVAPTPSTLEFPPEPPSVTLTSAGQLDLLDRAGLVALVPPALAPAALRDPHGTTGLWFSTNGSPATAAAIRAAALGTPGVNVVSGRGSFHLQRNYHGYRWFLYGVLGFVLLLAACSLAVTIVDQIYDRRRSLATLRALGTPLSTLRRATMLEIAGPLAIATLLGAVNGTVMGLLFLVGSGTHVVAPWLDVALFPALIAAGWIVVSAIGLAALGRAAPPVPARAG